MRILIFLGICPLFVFSQASVIVYRTSARITIGVANHTGNDKKESQVRMTGNYHFIVIGEETKKTHDAIIESCLQGKNLSEVLNLLKTKRAKSLADEMYYMKTYATPDYRRRFLNQYAFSILFFDAEEGEPKAAKIEFYVKDQINGGVTVQTNIFQIPGKDKNKKAAMIMGKRDAISGADFYRTEMNLDPAREIELLLRKQIKKTPEFLTFPIQIIQITGDSVVSVPGINS